MGKDVDDLVVFVLDKGRHRPLIREIRQAGARIQLHTGGDVAGALMAVMSGTGVDLMMGTGATPEGVLAATAIRIMGGEMQGMLDPQSGAERESLFAAGYDLDQVLTCRELVASDDVFFAATGITGGSFLRGVEFTGKGARTYSIVMRGHTGTIRYLEAHHIFERLMRISAIQYD